MTDPVLIVDDSLTVRMDLSDAFDAAGFVPMRCATVAEARATLKKTKVSLVVLDVVLPDGDGIDLLAELRASEKTRSLPVLLLSTEAEVKDRIRGLTTGADDYLGKPYDAGYVVSRAKQLVAREAVPPSRTILVVDDSATFRNELLGALGRAGYDAVAAPSGEEGLKLAAEIRPLAMIIDGVLPGIDGPSVVRRVRLDAALRRTVCVLLTGSLGPRSELDALDAGADAFVRKELDIEMILARLAAALRTADGSPGSETTASLVEPKKLLAVDDSPTYLNTIADALRSEGSDILLARSGEEALEVLAVQPVDCILLDLMMPGIGGHETCRRIKTSPVTREIPLIMLTALEDREAMLQGLVAGADDYIAKSADLEVLKARVRAQLRRKQFEDENRKIRERLLQSELRAVEARAAQELAAARAELIAELEHKNRELEAFSYSVSHDLRAPLRSIDGFSKALLEDYVERLDERGQRYLGFVRSGAQRMGDLIDDLLELSRVGRAELRQEPVDLADLARSIVKALHKASPERQVAVDIAPRLEAHADARLVRVVLDNLIGNAWKFSAQVSEARIEVGVTQDDVPKTFFVRDNGAGFDMAYAHRLFSPFQRLHSEAEFPGTGIGLATVQRIVERHGGRVWAESAPGQGATFRFTLEKTGGRSHG